MIKKYAEETHSIIQPLHLTQSPTFSTCNVRNLNQLCDEPFQGLTYKADPVYYKFYKSGDIH